MVTTLHIFSVFLFFLGVRIGDTEVTPTWEALQLRMELDNHITDSTINVNDI